MLKADNTRKQTPVHCLKFGRKALALLSSDCCIVIQMLKSGGPLVESVRTQESQSRVHCVLAARKKEITSSDQPQRAGIWKKEQHWMLDELYF